MLLYCDGVTSFEHFILTILLFIQPNDTVNVIIAEEEYYEAKFDFGLLTVDQISLFEKIQLTIILSYSELQNLLCHEYDDLNSTTSVIALFNIFDYLLLENRAGNEEVSVSKINQLCYIMTSLQTYRKTRIYLTDLHNYIASATADAVSDITSPSNLKTNEGLMYLDHKNVGDCVPISLIISKWSNIVKVK